MKTTALCAAAMSALLCVASYGQNDAADADVTCLVAIGSLPDINRKTHGISDELAQQTALLGTMYYMGKIVGRDPHYDIESALTKKLPQMDGPTLSNALARCGGELRDQGARWQAIGNRMIEKGKADAPKG